MSYQRYGRFDDERREFVIHRPDTPAPWVNYLFNEEYARLISQVGGGYSFFRSPRDGRITRHRYNALPADRPGHYLYVRDRADGSYWSPSWQPVGADLDAFECRHGLGYTVIRSRRGPVEVSIRTFVPRADPLEIWDVTLVNHGTTARDLDLFGYNELCLGHALVDLINQPNDQHFNQVEWDRERRLLLATKRYWVTYSGPTVQQANQAWDRTVFFATSAAVRGFEGSRAAFIGRYRDEGRPEMVEEGRLGNGAITAGDAVAALHSRVRLAPGRSRRVRFLLGVVPAGPAAADRAAAVVSRYRAAAAVDRAFRELRDDWSRYLSAFSTELPDPDMQRMANTWNQYQTAVTFRFGRDASYYHGGLLFGRGYRDSCQDLLGPLISRPARARARLLEMARYQMRDGSVFHLYYPWSGGGERTGHSDTPLWLPFAVCAWLDETGDRSILDAVIPFHDRGEASLLDHAIAALDYAISSLGPRSLALFGPGDWNDTLDYLGREGRGESVWVSEFLCYALRRFIPVLRRERRRAVARRFERVLAEVDEALNTIAWDGHWYLRGTRDDGGVIGSRRNREGRIFLNAQSWAVLSGVARDDRAVRCMDAAAAMLDTPRGPKILHPPYTRVDPRIGLATRCVPGKKENGAVFNHAVSWAIRAECELGRADRAWRWYRAALPMNPVVDIDRHETEPYVYSEYVTSPDHPTFGQASHSWLTGSSTWMLRNIIDGFLGLRPRWDGLEIGPALPSAWPGFRAVRRFRGAEYRVRCSRDEGAGRGICVEVDGRRIDGDRPGGWSVDRVVVPPARAGSRVEVDVRVGGAGESV